MFIIAEHGISMDSGLIVYEALNEWIKLRTGGGGRSRDTQFGNYITKEEALGTSFSSEPST